jgi:hypothetical protein
VRDVPCGILEADVSFIEDVREMLIEATHFWSVEKNQRRYEMLSERDKERAEDELSRIRGGIKELWRIFQRVH